MLFVLSMGNGLSVIMIIYILVNLLFVSYTLLIGYKGLWSFI